MAGRAEPVPPPQRPPRRGSALRLAPDAAGRVLPRTDPDGLFMPPPDETYAESCVRVLAACRRIMDLYAGRETSVLAVGHACNGARLLEGLMRIETVGRFQHGNCGMTLIEQKANGDFVVRYMNR
jgi:broad specificity phosphatase PhoE